MRTTFFDGKHLKGFNIPMSWDSDVGWDVYGKELEDHELYKRVAAVFRAVELNASALASVPFALVTESGTEYDTSDDWQNKVGILPNPKKLFRLWRKSLTMTNAAYGLLERNKPMRYIVPTTIKPEADKDNGLKGFWRQVGAARVFYPYNNKTPLIHMFHMDYDTELLPSENTEFNALMQAAGIMYYSDHFVSEFFQRGGIKPHMLMVKGVPSKEERERIESTWDKLMRGIRKYIGKVYNADAIEAMPLGAGVDDFKNDTGFYKQAIENVAMVTGIPLSMLLANSANYATARAEITTWFDTSVIPWAEFMAGELNDNLFSRMGLRLEFRPEATDPDQEEENRRAMSFATIAGILQKSNNPKANSIAAQIVGLDMPSGMDFDDLDERDESLAPPAPVGFGQQQPKLDEDGEPEEPEEAKAAFVPSPEQITELETWQDIVRRKVKKGQTLTLPLMAKHLPADIAGVINGRLEGVADMAGVKRAFDLSTLTPSHEYKTSEIVLLADAINRLAERVPDASGNEPAA